MSGPGIAPGSVQAMWSGGMGDTLFESTPRTWMSAGRERFVAAVQEASAWACARGVTIALRPHARHALSDLPSVLALLGVQKGGAALGPPKGVGVLLDPMAMLTAGLLPAADEHLERVLGAAAGLPGVVGVVVCNVRSPGAPDTTNGADHDNGPPLARVPVHMGEVDARLIVDAVRRHVPEHVPRVLEAGEVDMQVRALGSGGA